MNKNSQLDVTHYLQSVAGSKEAPQLVLGMQSVAGCGFPRQEAEPQKAEVEAFQSTGAVEAHLIGDDFKKVWSNHSNKWSGIALAANGKLYCSPFGASRVLRIDPATGATKLIGDEGATETAGFGINRWLGIVNRWSGIVAAADGKLYCSPSNVPRVLRIDPATDATELIGDDFSALDDTGGMRAMTLWSGIAAAADGKLYCSPCTATRVLRIDPAAGTTELIGDDFKDNGFNGIAAAADGKLYCSPYSPGSGASRVLRIDPATGETELIGDDLGGNFNMSFGGIMAAADGKLYLPMVGGRMWGRVLRIDPATGETELIGDKRGNRAGFPLVALPDGQLLCSGSTGTWATVRRMDLTTNEIKEIGAYRSSRVASYNWSGCAAAADGTLYFAPEEATRVLRIKVGLISDEVDAEHRQLQSSLDWYEWVQDVINMCASAIIEVLK